MELSDKEKFNIITNLHFNLAKSLEQSYYEFTGKKVKIQILVEYLIIILLSGCLCINPIYKNNLLNETSTTLLTTTSTILYETTTTTIFIPTVNKIIRFEYVNQTIDMSQVQKYNLLNMRTKYCFASACSAGFYEAKRTALDILGLKKSEFSERESSYYKAVSQNDINMICLPIHYSVNKTTEIVLDSYTWSTNRIDNYTQNYTDTNQTFFNNSLILTRNY
jgi:hypothetical protein